MFNVNQCQSMSFIKSFIFYGEVTSRIGKLYVLAQRHFHFLILVLLARVCPFHFSITKFGEFVEDIFTTVVRHRLQPASPHIRTYTNLTKKKSTRAFPLAGVDTINTTLKFQQLWLMICIHNLLHNYIYIYIYTYISLVFINEQTLLEGPVLWLGG